MLIAGIGFWDDHEHVPASRRFAVHLLAAVGALWSLTKLPAISAFGFELDNSLFIFVIYALMLVWLVNRIGRRGAHFVGTRAIGWSSGFIGIGVQRGRFFALELATSQDIHG